MITDPTRQRALRGHTPARPTPRAASSADHLAMLARRLTPRDRWICRMLWEHRVLTSHQITALAFPSFRSGRQRLRELHGWGVVDRFRPLVATGTAPMHYVLAPAGATVLAAENGVDVKDFGYRHERAFGIAHSLRLAHTVGVNEWFTALVDRARHPLPGEDVALTAWWSETRCARHFGDMVKPDGYGRWRADDRQVEWFLEYDLGTESLPKVAGKITGYAALAQATGITTPLLVWLLTAQREANARKLIHRVWLDLDTPGQVPIATAAADLLDPQAIRPSPADEVWLPLNTAGSTRRSLSGLCDAWPHVRPPTATDSDVAPLSALTLPPPPMPPPPASSGPEQAQRSR
ncbi:replication-relaxation family protein [Saccharothrix obliqua]|uniref:replication-relaxation family protein n=1 Tax=Saccharothrix obliqua TaxID=2861747 RepID=UPI001C5E31FE|nr:replication-relaxation family protein [Saccharothrix obliqua]MBW4717349.1 replication-relaxation family protein [Saccharothrix obliqua]